MRKVIIVVLGITAICIVAAVSCKGAPSRAHEPDKWNGGHCQLDGGHLAYEYLGSKYYYKCEICGKEYGFDSIQKYEE